jgi:hypothetical protein
VYRNLDEKFDAVMLKADLSRWAKVQQGGHDVRVYSLSSVSQDVTLAKGVSRVTLASYDRRRSIQSNHIYYYTGGNEIEVIEKGPCYVGTIPGKVNSSFVLYDPNALLQINKGLQCASGKHSLLKVGLENETAFCSLVAGDRGIFEKTYSALETPGDSYAEKLGYKLKMLQNLCKTGGGHFDKSGRTGRISFMKSTFDARAVGTAIYFCDIVRLNGIGVATRKFSMLNVTEDGNLTLKGDKETMPLDDYITRVLVEGGSIVEKSDSGSASLSDEDSDHSGNDDEVVNGGDPKGKERKPPEEGTGVKITTGKQPKV